MAILESKLIPLALYALSASYGKKRRVKAAAAAAEAEMTQEKEIIDYQLEADIKKKKAGEDAEVLAATQKLRLQQSRGLYINQETGDTQELIVLPGAMPPSGYEKVAGVSPDGNSYIFAHEVENKLNQEPAGTQLFSGLDLNNNQIIGTRKELDRLNPDWNTGGFARQIGHIKADGTRQRYSVDDQVAAFGMAVDRGYRVGDKMFTLDQRPQAVTHAIRTGGILQSYTANIDANMRIIGQPKFVKEEFDMDARKGDPLYDVIVPAVFKNDKKVTDSIKYSKVSSDRLTELEAQHGAQSIVKLKYNTYKDSKNKIISERTTLAERIIPEALEYEDITYEWLMANPEGKVQRYSASSFKDMEDMLAQNGLDVATHDYTKIKQKYKGSQKVGDPESEFIDGKDQERAIATAVNKATGATVQVYADDESDFNTSVFTSVFDNITVIGKGKVGVVNGTPSVVGPIDRGTTETTAIRVNGELKLIDDPSLTLEDKATATELIDVTVEQGTGRILKSNRPNASNYSTMASKVNGHMEQMPFIENGKVVFFGGMKQDSIPQQRATMVQKLTPSRIEKINARDGHAEEYVRTFAPVLHSLYEQEKAKSEDERRRNNALNKDAAIPPQEFKPLVEKVFDTTRPMLEIEGMREALEQYDKVSFEDAYTNMQQFIFSNTDPSLGEAAEVVVLAEDYALTPNQTHIQPVHNQKVRLIPTSVPAAQRDNYSYLQSHYMQVQGLTDIRHAGPAMMLMFDVERSPVDGVTPIADPNGIIRYSDVQAIPEAYRSLRNLKTPDGNSTYMDLFVAWSNGVNLGVKPDDVKFFANKIVGAADSFEDLVETQQLWITSRKSKAKGGPGAYLSPEFQDALLEFQPGMGGPGEKRFFAGIEMRDSAFAALSTANSFLSTYYNIDRNTGRATLLDATGIANFRLQAADLPFVASGLKGVVLDFLGGSGTANATQLLSGLDSFKQSIGLATTGRHQNLTTGNTGNTGRDQIEKIVSEMAAEVDAASRGMSPEVRQNLAARQFYLVTLAYQISAAVQGGTGGRTISDQDVALILNALRQGFLTSAETQVATIEAARDLIKDMYTRAKYQTSTDGRERAAYNTAVALSMAADSVYHIDMGVNYAVNYINTKGQNPRSPKLDPDDQYLGLTEDVFNERLNEELQKAATRLGVTVDDLTDSQRQRAERTFKFKVMKSNEEGGSI